MRRVFLLAEIFSVLLFSVFVLTGPAFAACADGCGSTIPCNDRQCWGQCPPCQIPPTSSPTSFFGQITKPQGIAKYGDFQTGLVKFANVLIKLLIGAAGLFAFFNIIIAGYTFMSAGGDAKKVEQAWSRIWQSLLGLLFVAGSFVLAAIFGWLIFGDASAILVPKIYGP